MNSSPETTLAALRREFPRYRIWLDPIPGRHRFVARRQHPGPGPHTAITSDPDELRAALTAPGQHEPQPTQAHPGGLWSSADTRAGDPDGLSATGRPA
jgi:hypothetical protein